MQQPLISVIVPVYNTAVYLPKCLDSILAQTYTHLEILCVNDGATDHSAEILAEYAAKDARIKVFTQANAGLSAARNTGLNHATGEWVAGVDSDDYLAPGAFEQAIACAGDEVDMVFFGVQDVREDGTPLPHDSYFDLPATGPQRMTPALAAELNVCFWSKIWRRSLIEKHRLRFPVGLLHEDEALFCMAAPYVRKVAFNNTIGYNYMHRGGSIMNNDRSLLKDALHNCRILRFVYDYYTQANLAPSTNPYFVLTFGRIYYQVERFCPPHQRRELADMFRTLAEETRILPHHAHDTRFNCMLPQNGLASFFIRRRSFCTQYRLGPVPLFARMHRNGKTTGWKPDFWNAMKGLVRKFSGQ